MQLLQNALTMYKPLYYQPKEFYTYILVAIVE